jgi:hypothetical protein
LEYLKSKEVKTKKDKEAIQMLEAVLNNLWYDWTYRR